MPRKPKPYGRPSLAPVTYEAESGLVFTFKKDGCWVGADAMYRLTPAEAHQMGLTMAKWGLGALQDEEVEGETVEG